MSPTADSKSPNLLEPGEKNTPGNNLELREYGTKLTFGQKAKRHCARFWWIHLIVFCLIVMLITLLLVYVAYPKIAQDNVNDAMLEFNNGSFTNPTSNSIQIAQHATLHSSSTFTPTLDAFPADLYLVTNGTYGSAPMLTLPLPRIHAKKNTNASVDSDAQITNLDQVSAYAVTVMTSEYVETALVGKTKLHLGGLPVQTVTFNTTSRYKALNSLKGFNTTDLLINPSAAAGTPNLLGNAQIPNPSLMTIALGNVTLELSTEAQGIVGNATIQNFTLRPGANTMPMTAIIDQAKVLASLNGAGKVNMTITGTGSVYNGQHLTYYVRGPFTQPGTQDRMLTAKQEKALASNVLVLEMNVRQILADSAAAASSTANATST